jgi:hypothetical protein
MEQLLDLLVNEEMEKAHELFHEIVVEKSRDIYENLIAEEAKDDDEEQEESMEDESDDQVDEETTFEIGGDPAEDLVGGISDADPMGGDDDSEMDFDHDGEIDDHEAEHGSEEERIEDLEDALEELKAEFEKLMAGEKDEPEHADMFGGDEEGEDDEDDEEDDEDDEDEGMMGMENSQVREYVERVGGDWEKGSSMKSPGPVGGGKGDLAGQATETNHQSIVSSGKGKPSTGATAHNILGGGKGVGEMSGTSPNADKGSRGLVGATKGEFTKGVTKNKTGSSKTAMPDGAALSKVSGGKASGEGQGWGSGKGDKAGQTGGVNTTSPLSGAPNRNA